MATFAFVNGKGGVGKSVTTLNAGVALSRMAYEVVAVDVDLRMGDLGRYVDSAGDGAGGVTSVLAGDLSLSDALVGGPEGVSVLPGRLDVDPTEDADPTDLPDLFRRLEDEFEFVLVDTPPGLRDELPVSVGAADCSLVVTTPTTAARTNAGQTVDLVDMAGGSVVGVVVSRARRETDTASIEADVGHPVVGVVPDDPAVEQSTVVTGESSDAGAAAAYEEVAHFLERCRTADDPVEVATAFDPSSAWEDSPGGDDGDATGESDGTGSESGSIDALPGESGTRMGSARDAEYHLEQVQDVIDDKRDAEDDG